MTTIITIASQKGGVGKTTTALNLCYSLGLQGKKVLIVDGDPQGGLSEACNIKKQTAKGLLHVLNGTLKGPDAVQPLYENIFSVIGSGVIHAEDISAFESAATEGQLTSVLREMAAGYDYMIIDAPVGVGIIVNALLTASDKYLVVINCKAGTMKTLPRLMRTADWVKKNVNPDLKYLGVLINMYDASLVSEEKIYTYFKSCLPRKFFFDTVINQDSQVETAGFRAVPVAIINAKSEISSSFDRLAKEFLRRVNDTAHTEKISINENSDDKKHENDFYTSLLKELCEKSDYYGAVIADEMGFPLADYNCPINTEALAAFTSVLGDSLVKAESILETEDANNIVMEINESDKVALHRFHALNSTYFLLVVCSQAASFPGLIEPAISEIITRLTE